MIYFKLCNFYYKLILINPHSRPSCEQILNHPIVQKRIEYFKSFAGEEESEDKCLLKTIHMPKNLLFLSDKLPKPNYDKQFKNNNNGIDENKNYRSFNKVNNNKVNDKDEIEIKDFNKGIHIKKPLKLAPLPNIPEEKITKNNININKEDNKQDIIKNNINNSHSMDKIGEKINDNNSNNILVSKSNNNINNNKMILKKDEFYYADILSKQKNDLRKIMMKNSNIRRIGYLNSNSQINASPIKDINQIFLANINNKSAPKKINNNKIIKNKYYIQSPSYLKGVEKYHENMRKLDYDYINNYNNNINLLYKEGPENKIVPKLPRRLSPIKKSIPNLI